MYKHNLYGVRVACDVQLIAGDGAVTSVGSADFGELEIRQLTRDFGRHTGVLVDAKEVAPGYFLSLYSDRPGVYSQAGRPWQCVVENIAKFSWEQGQRILYYQLLPGQSARRMAFWCVHIIIPMFLAFTRGTHFFHASSVVLNGGAVLFLAPSWGGKSSLARFALDNGARLLSDDKVALQLDAGSCLAVPSHPCIRPGREREELGAIAPVYSDDPARVRAIYTLRRDQGESDIGIVEQTGLNKIESLLRHRQYGFQMAQEDALQFVCQLADAVPLFTLRRPWGMEHMARVLWELQAHLGRIADKND